MAENANGRLNSGSAQHWLRERIMSIVLLPLTIGLMWIVVPLMGADYATVTSTIAKPIQATILCLFFVVAFKHLQDGLQVVIEDYVHDPKKVKLFMLANRVFCWAVGLLALYSVLKIALNGVG